MKKENNEVKADLLPSTYFAVLSIVAKKPVYGYELNEILEKRGYRNWVDLQFSSIYKSLKVLAEKGLISGTKNEENLQPSKKIYHITEKGERILQQNILYSLRHPTRPKYLFDLGLSALSLLTKKEVIQALLEYKDNLQQRIEFLEENLDTINNLNEYRKTNPNKKIGLQKISDLNDQYSDLPIVQALFERPSVMLKAEKEWIEKFLSRIPNYDFFND